VSGLVGARVLVADDDAAISEAVEYALRREQSEVDTVDNGQDALAYARADGYDVVLLNVMMPRLFGTEVCRTLRAESDVPIMLMSARHAEVDRVLGLELGADDYITKPFSMAELVARLRAILRRRELDRQVRDGARIQLGDLRVDLARHRVWIAEREVHLTRSEFRILALLASAPERVFRRREIMEELWQSAYVGDERACDIHISNLRRKLEDDAHNPARISTVRGVGYSLTTDVSVPTYNP
jgi:two-component system response regulator RegX3